MTDSEERSTALDEQIAMQKISLSAGKEIQGWVAEKKEGVLLVMSAQISQAISSWEARSPAAARLLLGQMR
jgi:hypothetical protein